MYFCSLHVCVCVCARSLLCTCVCAAITVIKIPFQHYCWSPPPLLLDLQKGVEKAKASHPFSPFFSWEARPNETWPNGVLSPSPETAPTPPPERVATPSWGEAKGRKWVTVWTWFRLKWVIDWGSPLPWKKCAVAIKTIQSDRFPSNEVGSKNQGKGWRGKLPNWKTKWVRDFFQLNLVSHKWRLAHSGRFLFC